MTTDMLLSRAYTKGKVSLRGLKDDYWLADIWPWGKPERKAWSGKGETVLEALAEAVLKSETEHAK